MVTNTRFFITKFQKVFFPSCFPELGITKIPSTSQTVITPVCVCLPVALAPRQADPASNYPS